MKITNTYEGRQPQISEREIERQYSKLKIELAEQNRVNCYSCSCGYITKTIDIHVGVTPMNIRCDCCGNYATSSFYNDIAPDIKPEYEWFIPSLDDVKKYRKNPAMLEHIMLGGLDKRRIK